MAKKKQTLRSFLDRNGMDETMKILGLTTRQGVYNKLRNGGDVIVYEFETRIEVHENKIINIIYK